MEIRTECTECSDGTVSNGKYLCHDNDYRIVDSNSDFVLKICDHDFPTGETEIGDYCNVKYCSCGEYWGA